jgi:hypothetical protein
MAKGIKLIDAGQTIWLADWLEAHQDLHMHYKQLVSKGWTFYVTEQSRGWCRYADKQITIPAWAIKRDGTKPLYLTWYCAHEMAHAFAGWQAKHGPLFMQELKRICPSKAQHYETRYKQRNALQAGISFEGLEEDF